MYNDKQHSRQFILEFRRVFWLADLYVDCWDAGKGGLHSDLGKAYLGKKNGAGGGAINQFWKVAISGALAQRLSVHEIANLINKDFKGLTIGTEEFDALKKHHIHDIMDRYPKGEGTLEPQAFREKLHKHYVQYLQDCIDYQDGEAPYDWSRLAEYLFHPNPIVGESIMSLEIKAPVHKEHVVPLRYLNNWVINELRKNTSLIDIRTFVESALKIVIIHKKEQMRIDYESDWKKDDMPPNWKIGDSVYDRLYKSGIKFSLY